MAAVDLEQWIPEERGSEIFNLVQETSAVERLARRETMRSDLKRVGGGMAVDVDVVGKNEDYPESGEVTDGVLLEAKKFGQIVRLAEEDVADSVVDAVAVAQREWTQTYVQKLDNASLGVTAAQVDGDETPAPFTSVYRAVSQAAAGNIVEISGTIDYLDFASVLDAAEASTSASGIVVIAHPKFKGLFRKLVDGDGRPLWVQGQGDVADTLFGYNVAYSRGAQATSAMTVAQTGNPLLIVAPQDSLILGVRSGPEFLLGDKFTADQLLLKGRSRRGFAVANPASISILEYTA